MDDFKTSHGELLNPYQVLKVSRDADRMQIKQAYRSLCRRCVPLSIIVQWTIVVGTVVP
jgi:preprotein translocase subunit Sec63